MCEAWCGKQIWGEALSSSLCDELHPVCEEYPKQEGRAALRFFPKGGTDGKTIVDLNGPESAPFVKAIGKTQLSSVPALSATDFFFIIVSAGMFRRWKLPGYHMNFFCHLIPTRREWPSRAAGRRGAGRAGRGRRSAVNPCNFLFDRGIRA